MASFEFLAVMLTGLGLTASIVYYSTILKNANKTQQMQLETRQTQHYFEFLQTVSTSEFIHRPEQFGTLQLNSFEDYMALSETDSEINYDCRAYLRWINGGLSCDIL